MNRSRSPVLALETAIAAAAFRIAPERELELANFRDVNGLSLVVEDGPRFRFHVDLRSHEVTTSISTLEFLWSSNFAHFVLYDEYCSAQRDGKLQFDARRNPRFSEALSLLNWSVGNLTSTGLLPWPSALPSPVASPIPKSDVHIANELFLCSVAWIIHHEIAHVRLRHQPIRSNRSIIEEQEADMEATRWILSGSTIAQESRKRTVGIAAAILAFQGLQKPSHFSIRDTHPTTYQRIDDCLTQANAADDDEVYAFGACVMQYQLAARGVRFAPSDGSFKEIFSECLIALTRS